jgi:hypothetical protein
MDASLVNSAGGVDAPFQNNVGFNMLGTKKQRIGGWVLSTLVSLFLIFVSASGKFTEWEGKEAMFGKFGFSSALMMKIGVVEVAVAILCLIPQTAVLGTIMLTGYLGGAIVTHLRVGDPIYFPLALAVLSWIGLTLRRPEIWALVTSSRSSAPAHD